MKRFISTSLLLFAVSAVAQTKINPNQVNWPTGAAGCVYAPATNTCITPAGTTVNGLTANTSGGAAAGSTFNGSSAVTFDYHSFGAAGLAASNTFTGANTNDFSGTSQFKLPVVAGYTSAASGEIGHDSTAHNWHAWSNGVDDYLALFPVASPPSDTNCAQFAVTGGVYTIGHVAFPCGNLVGGALGSAPYQSAASTTAFIASPTTSGHTFLYAWQPSGSAIAPTAVDLNTLRSESKSGTCSGTATSSTTLVMTGLGIMNPATCTGAASANIGVNFPYAVTLKNLSVVCGTSGTANAGSAVFTIYTQAVGATSYTVAALTVTYNNTVTAQTLVQDTTHTVALNAGDRFQLRFTTGTSETLANCVASIEADH